MTIKDSGDSQLGQYVQTRVRLIKFCELLLTGYFLGCFPQFLKLKYIHNTNAVKHFTMQCQHTNVHFLYNIAVFRHLK